MFQADKNRPIGGHIMSHGCKTILNVKKEKKLESVRFIIRQVCQKKKLRLQLQSKE